MVVTRFLRLGSPILQWRALAPLIRCGQHSLQVFCTGIVLSFCAHAVIELSLNSLWVQIVVGAIGISLMTAVAYYFDVVETAGSRAPFVCSNWRTRMTGGLGLFFGRR
jgi:hypothetical protein